MDPRVREAVLEKIDSAISNTDEVSDIVSKLNLSVDSRSDFAYGVAIGRIYNSFHYQTRRILKRNATREEFDEFLEVLKLKAAAIKSALGGE
jgi:hypothetical protein